MCVWFDYCSKLFSAELDVASLSHLATVNVFRCMSYYYQHKQHLESHYQPLFSYKGKVIHISVGFYLYESKSSLLSQELDTFLKKTKIQHLDD